MKGIGRLLPHLGAQTGGRPRAVSLLRSVGLASTGWEFPAELNERREGPPLTSDDPIDLML